MDPEFELAWTALAERGLANSSSYSHFVTTTTSNFTTFLQRMPYPTTFSYSPEVMVVLATLPLIALGLSGLTVAVFQLALARVNRTFIDLFIATALAFLGGLFQLFNVLVSEATGAQFMSPGLLRLQGVTLGIFVGFKFWFLFRRTQQPAVGEVPRLVRVTVGGVPVARLAGETGVASGAAERSGEDGNVPIRTGTSPGSGGRRMSLPDAGELPGSKVVLIHSGSYARWGAFGDVFAVFVFLFIFLVTFLDATWRLGFVRDVPRFRGIYSLSNALQIVLLIFFAGKVVYATLLLEARPRGRSFVRVGPLLAGLGIGFAVAVASLVPRLLLFSETPLGRLFVLLEMFIFLLEMMIRDHKYPHRDSWSFEPKLRPDLSRPSLAKEDGPSLAQSDLDLRTPNLPERIVVRRASFVPSWIDDQRLRALPARIGSLSLPSKALPGSSPLAQHSSAYLVPSPAPDAGPDQARAIQPDSLKPVLYIRTQMVPPRGAGESVRESEGVSTMQFPESVRMSDVTLSREGEGYERVGEEGRLLFPIEESPPLRPEGVVASPVSVFAQPLVPLAVLRQMSQASVLGSKATGSTVRGVQPSPSVYSGPNSSLGHDPVALAAKPVNPPPPPPATRVPQVIAAFESVSSPSIGSGGKPSPPNSDASPPALTLPASTMPPLRINAQSSATRPIVVQPGGSPLPYVPGQAGEVITIQSKRPQPTPLAQPHLSVESLAAEVNRGSGSTESGISILSTSRFPSPPPVPAQRSPGHASQPSKSGSVVTEGGLEFELMPPRREAEAARREEGRSTSRLGRQALNVTSFVLGERSAPRSAEPTVEDQIAYEQLRTIPSVSPSPGSGALGPVQSGADGSPAMSEFLIQQARATVVPSSAGSSLRPRGRLDSGSTASTVKARPSRQNSNLVVEAQGRQIPPRTGFLARTLASYASAAPPARPSGPIAPLRSGLPVQPRRPGPGPGTSSSASDGGSDASLFESYASREDTPGSSEQGVPFRMFEQPRTPPLHLIREGSDEGEAQGGREGEVERVVGVGKRG